MSFSISPAAASPSSEFPDLPPPPQPPPEAHPPLVIGPAVAPISPPAPPLPPPPSPESVPPAVAPVAADPPLTASPPPPVPDVTPPSPPLLPPSVASPPPSPPLLPPSVASPPPSATAASPPAPAAIIPAAPDVSSQPPQESKPLPRHHEPIPMKPSRKPHLPPPQQRPSVPSSPAKPQAQPLPTLLPPPSPASPPTETSSSESASPVSSEPFFAEIPLSPPASTAASPPAELLNGSLPLTVDGGQSQSIAGQSLAHEYHVSTGIIVGFAIGGVLLLAMVVLSCFVFRGRKKQKLNSGMEKDYYVSQGRKVVTNDVQYDRNVTSTKPHLITIPSSRSPPGEDGRPVLLSSLSSSVGTFTYNELTEATNNFSASNLLGEGGFGYVHKGVLSSGKEIAVKQLKMGSDQGEREFQAELDTISRVHHKHLVTLLGYCITGDARFLVYEFVSNKTLEFHLHGNSQPVMEWRTRLKIAIGSAKGLAYLHEDCSPTIIHRDIKAANILLDFNFEAKVSDFGLAKFFSDTNSQITHVSTRVVGTFGYLAPEYASSGKLTEKSDVYSYGVMLLELITGRPPISRTDSSMTDGLVDWARHLLNEAISTRNFDDIVDPRLQKNYEFDEMASLIECAAACVRHSAWLRPRMSQIVRALEEKEPLTDHGEGNTPGHSKMYSSLDMKRLTMALASQDYEPSRVSDNTSDYGLYPSCSSSDAHMTR